MLNIYTKLFKKDILASSRKSTRPRMSKTTKVLEIDMYLCIENIIGAESCHLKDEQS